MPTPTVIGIDVGGPRRGFHAVALRRGPFEARHFPDADGAAAWCRELDAQAVAVDAPCAWAVSGGSRLCERSLQAGGKVIQCFKTPTESRAGDRAFYGWVRNGMTLYHALDPHYRLYDGTTRSGPIMLETFPHAVVCALAGKVVPAKPKTATRRRQALCDQGLDDAPLRNIDFVDAALCALTAQRFLLGQTLDFGDATEGFIVVPAS